MCSHEHFPHCVARLAEQKRFSTDASLERIHESAGARQSDVRVRPVGENGVVVGCNEEHVRLLVGVGGSLDHLRIAEKVIEADGHALDVRVDANGRGVVERALFALFDVLLAESDVLDAALVELFGHRRAADHVHLVGEVERLEVAGEQPRRAHDVVLFDALDANLGEHVDHGLARLRAIVGDEEAAFADLLELVDALDRAGYGARPVPNDAVAIE